MVWYRTALRRAATLGPQAVSAAAVVLCLALTLLAVKTPWSPLPPLVIAASGLVASAALWFRGRWPTLVALVAAGANALSGNPGPLLISLFSAARAGSGWRLVVLAFIGLAGFLGPDWVSRGRVDANALLSALAATVVVLATGGYAAARRELTNSLRDRAERAEAEQHLREEQARTAERVRIAREMHDVLAHRVTLISLHAGGLEVNPHAEPARIQQGATLIRATAQEAVEELRNILGVLRAGHRDDDGDASVALKDSPDLHRLVESWAQAGTTVTLTGETGTLPAGSARAAYRLVQEGLTNAHKHAPGAAVTVRVARSDGTGGNDVTVTVTNEPPRQQAPPFPGAGVGLVGLAERFRLVGGTVRSGPDEAGGWCLEGSLPSSPESAGPTVREPRDQDTARRR